MSNPSFRSETGAQTCADTCSERETRSSDALPASARSDSQRPRVKYFAKRVAFAVLGVPVGLAVTAFAIAACSSDETTTQDEPSVDGGGKPNKGDSSTTDPTGTDSGTDSGKINDAGTDAPREAGNECFLNEDCPANQRCEGENSDAGAFCYVGTRGTGKNGVDECTSENDCESALCVEGSTSSGKHYCSGACGGDEDCKDKLPRCLGGLGICARAVE